MMEDKKLMCITLTLALRTTRRFKNLDYLEYNGDSETVLAKFKNGGLRVIGVKGDSGYDMIKDIVNRIGG